MNKSDKVAMVCIVAFLIVFAYAVGVMHGFNFAVTLGKWAIEQLNITQINETCVCTVQQPNLPPQSKQANIGA